MYRNCFLWLLLALWSAASALASPEGVLKEANAKYEAGNFQEAADQYESLIASSGPDATVYYNLGNARQRLKQFGPAILAYERARLLSPRDPDLLANLALARKASTAFEDPGDAGNLNRATFYFSRNEWSWLVAGTALLAGALVLGAGMFGFRRRWVSRVVWGVVTLSVLTSITGGAVLWMRRAEDHRGIVVRDEAALRLSPFVAAESLGTPVAGTTVLLGEKIAGFYYVEVPGSTLKGWLAETDVASILPSQADGGKISRAASKP